MKELLCIVGPTGVGKTNLAIELAKKFNGELVSIDSRQIYIGMDIATGKEADQGRWARWRDKKVLVIQEVPIFGLDLVYPDEQFSVYDWHKSVRPVIDSIREDNKLPILVGGTGFYLKALQGGIQTIAIKPNVDLRKELEVLSTEELVKRLHELDPARSSQVDSSNRRRLIRAIEVLEASYDRSTNQPVSLNPVDLKIIGLTMDRQALYQKVDKRIEKMFAAGLVEEAKALLTKYKRDLPAMTGIGYAEAVAYLENEMTLEEAIQHVKWRSHSYIRRQYTWFRKQVIEWMDVSSPSSLEKVQQKVNTMLD